LPKEFSFRFPHGERLIALSAEIEALARHATRYVIYEFTPYFKR
jgi:hypothetical protein